MSVPPAPAGQRRSGLSARELVFLHLANVAVAGSGLVYAMLRYLVRSDDPYAVVNHPWQPAAQHAHVVLAPLLVFALGLIWRSHVLASWARPGRPRAASGAALALLGTPMALSGVLIQAAVAPSWRSWWVAVHLASSALWVVAFVAHQLAASNGGASGALRRGTPGG